MKNSPSKKVSVIVPNYNYAKYISGRLKSIVRQTYPIDELIVLDDASTDESDELIRRGLERVKRIRPELKVKYMRNEKNSGKAMRQWLKGVQEASGDYVWIAEADDKCSRRFLEVVMRGFDDPGVVISYTESRIINGFGMMLAPNFRWSRDREKTGHFAKSYVKDGVDEICEIMAIRCTVPNVSAAVFKKTPEFVAILTKAAEEFEQAGDWYLYLRLLEKGKIAYAEEALNAFRVHRGSATKRGAEHYAEVLSIHEMVSGKYRLGKSIVEAMEKERVRIREKYGIME